MAAKLIYGTNCSADGYIEDASGKFDWSEPEDVLHQFFNDLLRPIGTHLLGRRLYETMSVWETMPELAQSGPIGKDFAEVWQAADKIVFSRTLEKPVTRKTRIERSFEPEAIRRLKAESSKPLLIGGAELAAQAFKAKLVDEAYLVVHPITVGRGKPAMPTDQQVRLQLIEERRFPGGCVLLHYRVN